MEPLDRTGWTSLSGDPNTSTPNLGYHFSYPDSGPATPSFPSPSFFPSSSSNVSSQSVPFQGSSTLMTAVISLSVFVVGLIGNTLAIYVVLRYAKMKTVTNIYILNLAVADELYILGLPFLTTQVKSSGVRAGFTKRRRSERKVTRMVVIIVVVFVLCWLPFFIINIINLIIIIPESSVTAGVYFFSVILSYVNSCANPLLYGFLSDNFRQSFRKVLCVRKANGVEDGDPSAPRMEKTRETTRDDSFLSPRNHDGHNGHTPQNSQAVQLEPCGSPGEETRPSGPTVIGMSSL